MMIEDAPEAAMDDVEIAAEVAVEGFEEDLSDDEEEEAVDAVVPTEQPDEFKAEMLAALKRLNAAPAQQAGLQQKETTAWVDPAERPEIVEKLDSLLAASSYDEQARKDFLMLTNAIARERTDHMITEARREWQAEQQRNMDAPELASKALQIVRSESGYSGVTEAEWHDVIQDVFQGNRQIMASAFDPENPAAAATRKQLADMALGRAYRNGKLPQSQRAQAPAPVRSAARGKPDDVNRKSWSNHKDVNSLLAKIYEDPSSVKIGGKE